MGEEDVVNHPRHYAGHPSGVECIEITRHLSFNVGNAFKYVFRAGEKGGYKKLEEDIAKALWYLNDELSFKYNQEDGSLLALFEIIPCVIERLDLIIESEPSIRKRTVFSMFKKYFQNPCAGSLIVLKNSIEVS